MDIPPIPASKPVTYTGTSVPSVPSLQTDKERVKALLEGITLKMTAKGRYYWDIQAYGALDEGLVLKLSETDKRLKTEFPENVTTIPDAE